MYGGIWNCGSRGMASAPSGLSGQIDRSLTPRGSEAELVTFFAETSH